MSEMIKRDTWQNFRAAGLLWWVNRILHLFGWAIVVELDDTGQNVKNAYPVRCSFRGFGPSSETEGFQLLTKHMADNKDVLLKTVFPAELCLKCGNELVADAFGSTACGTCQPAILGRCRVCGSPRSECTC